MLILQFNQTTFIGINTFSHLYHSFEKIWKGNATMHR